MENKVGKRKHEKVITQTEKKNGLEGMHKMLAAAIPG